MRTSLLLATSLAAFACQAGEGPIEEDFAIASSQQAIIGGVEAPFDEAVVAVRVGGLCTGTLVAPRVVLTAAHCVGDAIEAGFTNVGRVDFGDGRSPWIDSIPIVDMTMHRLYKPPAFLKYDIALVRLARPAPEGIEPLPISTRNLTDADQGLQLRVVGFGNTDGEAGTGAGEKRQVTLPLTTIYPEHISFGDRFYNTCQGDSGGPTFATFDGVEYVVGVTSFGATGCQGSSSMTRTDVMWDVLLTEVLNAWSGPCQNDGQCRAELEEECGYPDPDCDICGMDGVCGEGCELPDRDCPLAGLASDTCSSATDCETRLCVPAPEDDRVTYCSMTCDPSKPATQSGCFAPLTVCEEQPDGTGLCGFSGLTPGVQGATCTSGNDCRSGMCDGADGICVEPCGPGLPECGEDYECQSAGQVDVCSIPSGGTCNAGSGRAGGLSFMLVLLSLFAVRRRRI